MTAWMLAHDCGRPTPEVIADFKRTFGFSLSTNQISLFRSANGTQSRQSHGGGKPRKPVGYDRESKGYTLVKIAEEATVPQSKDNWRMKHVWLWEQAHEQALPKGWTVLFLDGDRRNFDVENLYAIPRKYIAQVNLKVSQGVKYHDKESFEAVLAVCKLDTAILDAKNRSRKCARCGSEFTPDSVNRHVKQLTCRACLDSGHKSTWVDRTPSGEGVCEKCGSRFPRYFSHQKRCKNCSTARYKRTV